MGVNRWNAVQKVTYFLKKSKVGKNEECTGFYQSNRKTVGPALILIEDHLIINFTKAIFSSIIIFTWHMILCRPSEAIISFINYFLHTTLTGIEMNLLPGHNWDCEKQF